MTNQNDSGREWDKMPGRLSPPGRTMFDDSIDASSDDVGGDRVGHEFSAGYDTDAATRIGNETTDTDESVERLRQLHEGRHRSDGEHSIRESERDKARISQAVCSDLPLNPREKQQVVSAVKRLNLDRFGNQKNIARVTLGVTAEIVDRQRVERADDAQWISRTDSFRELCSKYDVKMRDLTTIKDIVRDEINIDLINGGEGNHKRDPALPGPTAREDLPQEYWEEKNAQYWVTIARQWDRHRDSLSDALPEEYRRLVRHLRRWEPWEMDETPE